MERVNEREGLRVREQKREGESVFETVRERMRESAEGRRQRIE